MADKLELYRHILGPRAEALERRAEALAPELAGKDAEWCADQRARQGDPFVDLERIVTDAADQQLDYAAERIAVAVAVERLGPAESEDGPGLSTATPGQMLGAYEQDLGRKRVDQIKEEGRRWFDYVKGQDPEWVRARARELADPYPAPAALDRELTVWFEDNHESAAATIALERAELELAAPSERELEETKGGGMDLGF